MSGLADLKVPFMCKAASLPAFNLGVIKVPYFGREINVAGTRKFEDWSVTIIGDEDHAIRNAMETWSNAINSLEGNLTTLGTASPLAYKSQATVTHFSRTGAVLRTYQFNGMWPVSVSGVPLDWSNGDAIMEFQCQFAFDDFEITSSQTGDAGGV